MLPPDLELFKGDALAVKHAEDVVIGLHKQLDWVRERLIAGKPSSLGVAVGAHDGLMPDAFIQSPRDGARLIISREKPVVMEKRHFVPLSGQGCIHHFTIMHHADG